MNAPSPHVMPFGRHADKPLSALPATYLDWLLLNVPVGRGLRAAIVDELVCRRGIVRPCNHPFGWETGP
jgi:hypothetical protein